MEVQQSHHRIYDSIGRSYATCRQPDPRIAAAILDALGAAKSICNIGAGAGSYEPTDQNLTAVEPSEVMIAQRESTVPVVRASAENLPFEDNEFDAAMAILTVHHWEDPERGLAEMRRVSRRQIVFAFDNKFQDMPWIIRDYLPEFAEFGGRSIPLEKIAELLGTSRKVPVPIPHDCTDGFLAAYWRRPEMYLRDDVQASISVFAQFPREVIDPAMERLRADIESGVWIERNSELLAHEAYDFGYSLIIAE